MARTKIDLSSWFVQPVSPIHNGNYQNERRPDTIPYLLYSLDGKTEGEAVNGGSPFDYWASMGSLYGTNATTSVALPGETSSARLSIQQGSDGLSEYPTNGQFGGGVAPDLSTYPELKISEGGEVYIGHWAHIPAGFDWETPIEHTKFMRVSFKDVNDVSRTSRLDFLVYHNFSPTQVGWRVEHESDSNDPSEEAFETDKIMTLGQNVFLSWYIKFSNDPLIAETRLAVDGDFVYQKKGTNLKYRDVNGVVQNRTIIPSYTLEATTDYMTGMMFGTYWNGGNTSHSGPFPTQDQELYIPGKFGFATEEPLGRDSEGYPILDSEAFRT